MNIFSPRLIGLLFVVGLIVSTPAHADTSEADALIARQDFVAFEALAANLHAAHIAGDVAASALRTPFSRFSTTSPDIEPMVDAWLSDMPVSPYAHAAATWYYNGRAWRFRGSATYQWTHPAAMEAFYANLNRSQEHAWIAYEAAPDLLAATDALLLNEKVTGELGPRGVFRIVEDVMNVTPNRGTVYNAASAFQHKWGGDPNDIRFLCYSVAGRLPTLEGYTSEVCEADVALTQGGLTQDRQADAIAILRAHESERFDHHWMDLFSQRIPPERFGMTYEDVADVLMQVDYYHYGAARVFYSIQFDRRPPLEPDQKVEATQIILLNKAHARAALQEDPGNLELHRMATYATRTAIDRAATLDRATRFAAVGELLRASPYSPHRWQLAANSARYRSENGYWQSRFDLLGNVIAYSNHNPPTIGTILRMSIGYRTSGETEAEGFDLGLYREEVVCPSIRIGRLYDAVCAHSSRACQWRADLDDIRADLLVYAAEPDMCHWEKTAPFEEIAYRPTSAQVGAFHYEGE